MQSSRISFNISKGIKIWWSQKKTQRYCRYLGPKRYRNLLRLHKWGLNVPEPLAVNKNVLVMDFIGNEISHARRLRDSEIPNPKAVYEELVEFLAVVT